MSKVLGQPNLQNCSQKNLSSLKVAWESCLGSDEYQVTATLLTNPREWTLATLSYRTAAEPKSKFQYSLRKQGVASGVLETKAYRHRRPAYNPETFPHCPRWKRCCRLESFGAVHFSLIHHVTVSQLRFHCLSFLCWQFCMFIFCWPFFDVSKLLAHDVTRHSAANYI